MSTPVPCTAHEGCVVTVMAGVPCASATPLEVITAAKIAAVKTIAKRVVRCLVQRREVSLAKLSSVVLSLHRERPGRIEEHASALVLGDFGPGEFLVLGDRAQHDGVLTGSQRGGGGDLRVAGRYSVYRGGYAILDKR